MWEHQAGTPKGCAGGLGCTRKKLSVEFRSRTTLQLSFDTLPEPDLMKTAFTNPHRILPDCSQSFQSAFPDINSGRKEKPPHGSRCLTFTCCPSGCCGAALQPLSGDHFSFCRHLRVLQSPSRFPVAPDTLPRAQPRFWPPPGFSLRRPSLKRPWRMKC